MSVLPVPGSGRAPLPPPHRGSQGQRLPHTADTSCPCPCSRSKHIPEKRRQHNEHEILVSKRGSDRGRRGDRGHPGCCPCLACGWGGTKNHIVLCPSPRGGAYPSPARECGSNHTLASPKAQRPAQCSFPVSGDTRAALREVLGEEWPSPAHSQHGLHGLGGGWEPGPLSCLQPQGT